MTRPSLRQRISFLVVGLELPALVLLGLFGADRLTGSWTLFWRTLTIMLASSSGFVVGSFILWWTARRVYDKNQSP